MNGQINFSIADIEQLMWSAVLETFQQAMVEILSTLDVYLMATRDKNRYEYKEIKEKSYVTMVGSINIRRRYYWDKQEKKWVFLLDQALELAPREQISACLKELVVLWGTKGPSYRDARDRLEDLYGHQVISHEKIRQLLVQASGLLKAQIIINGDLAPWIRAGTEYFKNALYQYDRFHLKRDVRHVLRGSKKHISPALEQIDENNPVGLLEIVRKAAEETECLERRFKVLEFETRLRKHKDALIDYRERLKVHGVEISPPGVAWERQSLT